MGPGSAGNSLEREGARHREGTDLMLICDRKTRKTLHSRLQGYWGAENRAADNQKESLQQSLWKWSWGQSHGPVPSVHASWAETHVVASLSDLVLL